jgi:K+-sensing histidine kinase KdpD
LNSFRAWIKKSPFIFAMLTVVAAGAISFILDAWFLPTQGTLLIFQLAVVITAFPGNKPIAIFAGILSGVIFNYFFTTPRFSLHMSDVDDIVNLFIFLIVAVLTGYLAAFYRAQQEALELAELRASILMSVSHDLRTPLSTIIGSLTSLQEYQDRLPKPEKEELLQGALEESHRLHRYIENLLQATKLHQGIKLNGIKQELFPIINNVVSRFDSDRIQVIFTGISPKIFASAYLLEQAIYNVIDNALKYSPSIYPVKISYSTEDNSTVHLDVSDKGPGIANKNKDAVFDLFFSTRKGDAGQGGSGMGLTVAKGIIEAHKGSISILPDTTGCVVRISLPCEVVS